MKNLISRTYKGEYAKRTIILPVVGEITFNEDGSLDVADESAQELIDATIDSFAFKVSNEPEMESDNKSSVDENLELKELLDMASTNDLLSFVKETKDEKFIEKVATSAMTDDKIRKELYKKLKK